MNCTRYLRPATRQLAQLPRRNNLHTTPALASQPSPRQGTPSSSHNPSAATSTSAAQPFSETHTPNPSNLDLPIVKDTTRSSSSAATVKSSVQAGTVLKGLNFVKGKQDPVAKEDHEYPAWLWGVLKRAKVEESGIGALEGDLFSKSKKQRRVAAKAMRKQQLMNPEALAPKVPLQRQTVDLPGGDGSLEGAIEALEARDMLTKAMRKQRRAGIKEANFLKAMG